jgi:hypothetical protein
MIRGRCLQSMYRDLYFAFTIENNEMERMWRMWKEA